MVGLPFLVCQSGVLGFGHLDASFTQLTNMVELFLTGNHLTTLPDGGSAC
jgi:hypothetical protein